MKTTLLICGLMLVVGSPYFIYLINKVLLRYQLKKSKQKEHELLMLIERHNQVFSFRSRLIHEIPNVVKNMPTYDEMVESDKPLIAKEWVNVDNLFVSERIETGRVELVDLEIEFLSN